MINLTEDIVNNLFDELNEKLFDLRLPKVPVVFNDRFRTIADRATYSDEKKLIELNRQLLQFLPFVETKNILAHKQIHIHIDANLGLSLIHI